ncbi:hypothetical protein Trydic_g9136 [Trypoxylus dichotomus]
MAENLCTYVPRYSYYVGRFRRFGDAELEVGQLEFLRDKILPKDNEERETERMEVWKLADIVRVNRSRPAMNEQRRIFRWWAVVQSFEGWKKFIAYSPLAVVPIIWHHGLWLSYVAGGQIIALALFHLLLSFKGRRRRKQKDRLMHAEIDSFESSKFEEITEVLDDGLPEPIPGSSHSIFSDSLAEPDTILEI